MIRRVNHPTRPTPRADAPRVWPAFAVIIASIRIRKDR
jgi:hypothetical protein